jgi:hypothetical protein
MRRLRADLSGADSVQRFRGLGVDVLLGHGRFAARDALEVAGARLPFRRAVIVTGTRPAVPHVPGLADAEPYTNETVFSLTELPRRLAVVGGAPVGCELAQSFARFGSQVTLLQKACPDPPPRGPRRRAARRRQRPLLRAREGERPRDAADHLHEPGDRPRRARRARRERRCRRHHHGAARPSRPCGPRRRHPYPTQGEIVRKAADAWQRTRLTPAARRVLGRFLGVLR